MGSHHSDNEFLRIGIYTGQTLDDQHPRGTQGPKEVKADSFIHIPPNLVMVASG